MRRSLPQPERKVCIAALVAAAAAVVSAAAVASAEPACAYLSAQVARQPEGAVLLPSYPDAPPGPLRQAAFLYDNAVAAIALVGCGEPMQAQRIGAAIRWALEHDRHWHDGRLRNGYAAGPVSGAGLMRMAGWWDPSSQRWLEDEYQSGSDSGNLAWAVLALLTLEDRDGRHRLAATRIARWLESQQDDRGAGGFTGGTAGSEAAERPQRWKSTEHNVDLAAAFARLAAASGDAHWRALSGAAAGFVAAMWDGKRKVFAAGTGSDGVTRNALLALDAQVWPLLALPGALDRYGPELTRSVMQLRAGTGVGAGFSYSEADHGLWTEGTAQAALLGRLARWPELDALSALEAVRAGDGGYFATTQVTLATGFGPSYLHLEHLGAAAWVALARQGFNPFTGTRALPPEN
jgi:hypothetical protein